MVFFSLIIISQINRNKMQRDRTLRDKMADQRLLSYGTKKTVNFKLKQLKYENIKRFCLKKQTEFVMTWICVD